MTVDEMLFISRLLLGLTIVGVIASVGLYFLLEINKALHVVTGRTYKVKVNKNGAPSMTKQTQRTKQTQKHTVGRKQDEMATRVLHTQEQAVNEISQATTVLTRVLDMSMQEMKGSEPTVVLYCNDTDKTALLENPKNKINMLVDITYVHTDVII